MSALLIMSMLLIYGNNFSVYACNIKKINVLINSTPWIGGAPFKGIACSST